MAVATHSTRTTHPHFGDENSSPTRRAIFGTLTATALGGAVLSFTPEAEAAMLADLAEVPSPSSELVDLSEVAHWLAEFQDVGGYIVAHRETREATISWPVHRGERAAETDGRISALRRSYDREPFQAALGRFVQMTVDTPVFVAG